MFAIYKKELKSFFHSMLGWLFLAANLFFSGWYFRHYGMIQGYPYVSYVLSGILFIFLFSMPILTMKSFAEETRQRTDQLLYTAPISVWKVIAGKYLATVTLLLVMILVIALYPLVLGIYGDVPPGENFVALLGFFMFGMACLAIGILLSSITENQIIAAVLTFFVLMVTVMIPGICNLISPGGNVVTKMLTIFDITSFMEYNLYGMLYMPSFLYYLSVVFICLYLTGFIISKKRWRIATHGIWRVLGNISGTALLILLIVAVNVGVNMLPKELLLKDLTYNNIYSLTEESKGFLDGLNQEVTLYVWAESANIDSTIQATVDNMAEYSEYIDAQYISPTENPYFYAPYTEQIPAENSIIVVGNGKSRVIDYYECYQMQYDYEFNMETGDYMVTDYEVSGYDGEGRIVSAIHYVASNEVPKIYCITGHDELQPGTDLTARISKANIDMETINLLTYDAIPEDASGILVLGPLVDLSQEEVQKIEDYLKKGNNAIFVVAYTDAEELQNYYSLFSEYGITVNPGLVMEQGSSFYNTQPYYLLPEIVDTDLTEGIYSNLRNKYIYMPYAKGLLVQQMGDVSVEIFLRTTPGAYCLEDISGESDGLVREEQAFALGVYATKAYADSVSEVVVYSSDYFLYEDVDMAVNGNNYDLFMNSVNRILGTGEVNIIPVKMYTYDPIIMDATARSIFTVLFVGLIPAAFLAMGIVVWYKRKKR